MVRVACFVGLDWSDAKHAYTVKGSEGIEDRGIFKSDPETVHEWVRKLRQAHPEGVIRVGLEQSRGPLMYALSAYDFLELVPINPLAAKSYRDSLYLSGAKDDPVDADLICDFVRTHETILRVWRADDANTRKLRLLVEGRRTLIDHRTALTQALSATLKQYFPQILSWFGEANTKLTRAFLLRWPSLGQVVQARSSAIRTLVQSHSRKKSADIDALVEKIRTAVALTTDSAIVDAMSLLATSYVTLLAAIEEPIHSYEEEIAKLWSAHPDQTIFASFPGAGPVMAPRLAVAFGTDRTRFTDATEMQCYSGIAPVIERSGKKTWTHSRWRCSQFLKQTFHEFAAASLPFCSWALAFYRQQRERGAGHHAAVRALAFRWIRILFHCWKTNRPYDDKTYIEALKRRNSPLVARLAA
jgi:transposase